MDLEAFAVFWRSEFSSSSVVLGKTLDLCISVICSSTEMDVYGVRTLGAWAWWSFFRNTGARVERVTRSLWRV